MSTNLLQEYTVARDTLLERIVTSLKQDPRFVAAWLTGSFGRGDFDEVSDLDLTVVVSRSHAVQLCDWPETITTRPPNERLDLFGQFGDIDFAYENNRNAPAGGTATNVMYSPLGLRVDWVLVPKETAQRPENVRLLFSNIELPSVLKPEVDSQEERVKEAAKSAGFFWLMATTVAKYLIRGDGVFVTNWLEYLTELTLDVEHQIDGTPDKHHRGSLTRLYIKPVEQIEQLQQLCERIKTLMPRIMTLGGEIWLETQSGVEHWLSMAAQETSQAPSVN